MLHIGNRNFLMYLAWYRNPFPCIISPMQTKASKFLNLRILFGSAFKFRVLTRESVPSLHRLRCLRSLLRPWYVHKDHLCVGECRETRWIDRKCAEAKHSIWFGLERARNNVKKKTWLLLCYNLIFLFFRFFLSSSSANFLRSSSRRWSSRSYDDKATNTWKKLLNKIKQGYTRGQGCI